MSQTVFQSNHKKTIEAVNQTEVPMILRADKRSDAIFTVNSKRVTMPQLLSHNNSVICVTLAETSEIMESLSFGVPVIMFAENDE